MIEPEKIRDVFDRYAQRLTAGDADGMAALYAENGQLEDPVGNAPVVGREAIRKFYAASAGRIQLSLGGPVRVCGHEAAAPLIARVKMGGRLMVIEPIDVMTFDDEGLITSMRAFWSTDGIRYEE